MGNKVIKSLGIERQIELYDNMKNAYGTIPKEERAGDKMAEIGLIGKAIEYYNASEKGWSKECEELEKLVHKSEQKIRENTRITSSQLYKNPEEIKRKKDIGYSELEFPEDVPVYEFTLELEKTPQGKN